MTTQMTLRELANSPKLIDKYSSIEIINKRKKERRGMYLSEYEAREYEEMKEEKIKKSKQEKITDKQNKNKFFSVMDSVIGIGNGMVGDMSKEEQRKKRYTKFL